MELPSTKKSILPRPGGSQEQGGEAAAPIWLILPSCVALLVHSLLLPDTGLPALHATPPPVLSTCSPHPDHASKSPGSGLGQPHYRLLCHALRDRTHLQLCSLETEPAFGSVSSSLSCVSFRLGPQEEEVDLLFFSGCHICQQQGHKQEVLGHGRWGSV